MAQIIPQAFLNASATKSETKAKLETKASTQKVTARIDMSAEVAGAGLCPECKKPMQPCIANDIPVLICQEHRIVIPTPDAPTQE